MGIIRSAVRESKKSKKRVVAGEGGGVVVVVACACRGQREVDDDGVAMNASVHACMDARTHARAQVRRQGSAVDRQAVIDPQLMG